MKPTLLLCQIRPLLPQMPQNIVQDRDDAVGIDELAPGDNVGVNEVLDVEKGHDHLLGLTGMDSCLYGARLSLFRILL
jgi:hypothetical protein